MTYIETTFECPKCGNNIKVKLYSELDKKYKNKILNRTMFMHKCNKCKESVFIDYPFKYIGSNYDLYYKPSKVKRLKIDKDKISRKCLDYDDLREKILIFDDNYNDILIEFIKDYIKSTLDGDLLDKVYDIKYDSCNDKYLIFTLLGANQNVGISIDMYNEWNDRSKFKKINKAVIINNMTYFKYHNLK